MQRWMHVRRSLDFLSLSLSRIYLGALLPLSLPSFPPIVPPPPFHSDVYFAISSSSLPLPLNRRLQEEKISIPFNWIIAAELRFREKAETFFRSRRPGARTGKGRAKAPLSLFPWRPPSLPRFRGRDSPRHIFCRRSTDRRASGREAVAAKTFGLTCCDTWTAPSDRNSRCLMFGASSRLQKKGGGRSKIAFSNLSVEEINTG